MENSTNDRPALLYDDSCGFCKRWVPFWKNTLDKAGIGIAPLQSDWVRARLNTYDEELLKDILMLFPDKTLIRGANAYREAMRRIWWAYPLYLISILPVASWIFNNCYRVFNRNRYRVSRACGWNP